jgi:branched-chain amino acid transport system substrate-binding protein
MPEGRGGWQSGINRRTFIKGAGSAGVVALAGCSGDGGDGGDGGSDGGDGGSDGGDGGSDGGDGGSTDGGGMELKVGVITSRSGSYSFLGEAELQGAELAKQHLESEEDVSIEIVEEDTETDPSTGQERMRRLVTRENVDYALGGVSSSVAIQMGTWASDNGVAYMAAGSHSDATTGGQCAPNMFRPTCSNSMLANAVGGSMADIADSWVIMFADYTWGQTGRDAVQTSLQNAGGSVAGTVATPFPSQDYTQYLNQAASIDAEGLAIVIAGTDQRIVTQQFFDGGFSDQFEMAGPLFEEAVFWGLSKEQAAATGTWATPYASSVPHTDFGETFRDEIVSEFDASPFSRHEMGFLSMDQLTKAALRAGSTEAGDIRSELEGYELERTIKSGDHHWRADDHQLIQPVDTVSALPVDQMQDDPYQQWYEHNGRAAGEDVARSDSGCSF